MLPKKKKQTYPLVNEQFDIENGPIEIVDLPKKKRMVSSEGPSGIISSMIILMDPYPLYPLLGRGYYLIIIEYDPYPTIYPLLIIIMDMDSFHYYYPYPLMVDFPASHGADNQRISSEYSTIIPLLSLLHLII